MLRLDKITKSFGEKKVIADLSAKFAGGSRTLVMGPSGSGKTTLLRIIAGLETADSGNIILREKSSISFMFQEPRLFPWMDASENVSCVLKQRDASSAASAILTDLGLEKELRTMPSALSGGMQRRVALARALVYPADLYLFDEPFAGLDPKSAKLAAEIIFHHTVGKTVIIVSHDRSMLEDDIKTICIDKI